MNSKNFGDEQMFGDILSSQKFITGGYNTAANEASEPGVKSTMMSLLEDEHNIGHEIFLDMKSRGWYQTEAAEQAKINQTKQNFCQDCKGCC